MFLLLDSPVQRLLGIIRTHIDRNLGDDGPVVDLLVDEMHRDPGDRCALGQCLSDSIRTRELRKKGGMDVDDTSGKAPHRLGSKDPHETGQDHSFSSGLLDGRTDAFGETAAIAVPAHHR